MGDFNINSFIKTTSEKIEAGRTKGGKVKSQAASYFKTHWLDYVLLFFILLVLGAFDVFVLKRSDNFLKPEYWWHSLCRLTAYTLAIILGVRIGYPRAKNACEELAIAFEKNRKLVVLKEMYSVPFGDFILGINLEVKKSAWKFKINSALQKLEKHVPNFFPLFYRDRKLEHFDKFKKNKPLYKHYINRAEIYCEKRKNLEALLEDDYINENINTLNVKFPTIKETDFNFIHSDNFAYKTYHTKPNVKASTGKKISSSIMFSALIVLVMGSLTLSFDEALAQERIVTIFSIIINSILDVGLTIWKFLAGYFDCERIVRQEDLRANLDQNEILTRFSKTLSETELLEYKKVVENEKITEKTVASD